MFLIVLLLAVWGGVGVWWFMNRPEGRSADSIGSFRQQLRVLERAGPTTVAPAYRMTSPDLGVYGAQRVPTMSDVARAVPMNPTIVAARRRRAQKRRRDVFYGLLAAIGGSLFLGFLPGLSVMWWLAALLIASLAMYIVVLMQLKAAVAQTRPGPNVRYLRPALGRPEPAAYLLRRSATN